MAEEATLCRYVFADGSRLSFRYTLSTGEYVGEIDMTARGGADVWQMLAYDLLQITSAAAQGAAMPETNKEPVFKGVA